MTVPVGVSGVPGDVSVTVAVHENAELRISEQMTLVEVERFVTVRGENVTELPV